MIFNNGTTDNLTTDLLSNIQCKIRYGVFEGKYPLNAFFKFQIPDYEQNSGIFEYETPFLAGGQKITITWDKDFEHQMVKFRIHEVTPPC